MLLLRSKADPSIIAVLAIGSIAVKLKVANIPYEGEWPVGSTFNYAARLWTPCAADDQEAKQAFASYLATVHPVH